MKFEEAMIELRKGKRITNDYLEPDESYALALLSPEWKVVCSIPLSQKGMVLVKLKGEELSNDMMFLISQTISFKQLIDESWRLIDD